MTLRIVFDNLIYTISITHGGDIMSKLISLKIKDNIFQDVEDITKKRKIPRNAYINQALEFYNKFNTRANLKKQLQFESDLVKHNSLEVLEEFEKLEDEIIE